MVGHDLVSEDFNLWAKLKHPLLLVDEDPAYGCLFHLGMNAIVGEFAENGFSSFGHHGHMHDARLAPCAWLLPSGGFVRYVGVGGHS